MGIWLGPIGAGTIEQGDFSYAGDYVFTVDPNNSRKWELAILSGSASDLVFLKNPGLVDIFMVAGGQSGSYGSGYAYGGSNIGGKGGNGGECKTESSVALAANTNYKVTIGASDGNTTFSGGGLSFIAVSGNGKPGGAGGQSSTNTAYVYDATPGTDGDFAFGEQSSTLITPGFIGHRFGQGGGGAGGMIAQYPNTYSYMADGARGGKTNNATNPQQDGSAGAGARTSGIGGHNGTNGLANHGQGGGGAELYANGYNNANGYVGSGGSGVMFIRPHQ